MATGIGATVAGAAQTGVASLSDQADSAVKGATAAVNGITAGEKQKSLLVAGGLDW